MNICSFPIEKTLPINPNHYNFVLDILLLLGEYAQIQSKYFKGRLCVSTWSRCPGSQTAHDAPVAFQEAGPDIPASVRASSRMLKLTGSTCSMQKMCIEAQVTPSCLPCTSWQALPSACTWGAILRCFSHCSRRMEVHCPLYKCWMTAFLLMCFSSEFVDP